MAAISINTVPSLALRAFMGLGVIREGLPMSREPALLTSAGRMPERSQHRVSEGQDARSERPATGHGQPRTVASMPTARLCQDTGGSPGTGSVVSSASPGGTGTTAASASLSSSRMIRTPWVFRPIALISRTFTRWILPRAVIIST